ncbi:hypothetical protein K3495_g527 [Podosphaera aphanis]|nr:hypothetical protein K3495_g527 [Podosphaera aphanis]
MTAPPAPTIIELKTAFLRDQVRTLSTPLQVPTDLPTPPNARPSTATIAQAVRKVNQSLARHNRLVYGPRALRHVAEQIDQLYLDSASPDGTAVSPKEVEAWADRCCDYTSDDVILQLPNAWNDPEADEEAAEQFQRLQAHLVELSASRKHIREQLEMCRSLKALAQHFGSRQDVQKNLVTRNGEVEKELEKMRRLMIRVERGLTSLVKNNSVGEQNEGRIFNSDNYEEDELSSLFV